MSKLPNKGFTLAELLIALLILGEIATFTIPKILSSSQNGRKKVVLKETISVLSEATYLFCLSPESSTNPNPYEYMAGKINALKLCPSDSSAQGCIGASSSGEITEPGFMMHNGASVAGLRNSAQPREGLIIDWNGSAGPNVIGDDQIEISINFTQTAPYFGVGRCRVGPTNSSAASVTFFQDLFTN